MIKFQSIYIYGDASKEFLDFCNEFKVSITENIEGAKFVVNFSEKFMEDKSFLRSVVGRALVSVDLGLDGMECDIKNDTGYAILFDRAKKTSAIVGLTQAAEVYKFPFDYRTLVNNLASEIEENII